MPSDTLVDSRYHYEFIHNAFGHFVKDTLDYFSDYLYPRFSWKVVSTYDKAVEYLNKQAQYNRETDMPNRPALILNPSGEMNIDPTYGQQPGRFPNIAPGLTKYLYDPIYQDEQMIVTVGFTRLKGEIEMLALLPSMYEYFDLKILLLQMFRGVDHYIMPIWIRSFIIIPEDLYNYEYYNEYTGQRYKIDWDNHGVTSSLIPSINRTEYIYPVNIQPQYKLTGISDASTRLGGMDRLPDWRLTFNLEYEIELPSFVVLESDYLTKYLNFELRYGSNYSVYSNEPPEYRDKLVTYMDATSAEQLEFLDQATIVKREQLMYRTRYYHELTQAEVDSTSDIQITIPEVLDDVDYILVNCKYGLMAMGDHYKVESDMETLTLKTNVLQVLSAGDILELYLYEKYRIKDQE